MMLSFLSQVFTDLRSGDGETVWIDTVGYDDTGNKDDEEIFRNILKFIQSQNLTKVNMIFFCFLLDTGSLTITKRK